MVWTRTSDNWNSTVGSFDKLNAFRIFPSSNKYEIPDIKRNKIRPPKYLIPYNIRVRSDDGYRDAAMHFFLDDYRFELVWTRPRASLSRVTQSRVALTPDFSIYVDYPIAAQVWNVYRNRWCGAYWQENGVSIIPTVGWSDERSYDFCFDGIAKGCPVAVSSQGIKSGDISERLYNQGFAEMIRRIEPEYIVCYGNVSRHLKNKFSNYMILKYPTYWTSLKDARRQGKSKEFFRTGYNRAFQHQ